MENFVRLLFNRLSGVLCFQTSVYHDLLLFETFINYVRVDDLQIFINLCPLYNGGLSAQDIFYQSILGVLEIYL